MCVDVLGFRVVLRPDPLELVQVMWPQNGPIPGQVVKVVHDNGNKQVDDLTDKKYIVNPLSLLLVVVVVVRYHTI